MLRDVRRKNREELEERVCFWADNATGAMPSPCGGSTGAGTLLSALWTAVKALLKGL